MIWPWAPKDKQPNYKTDEFGDRIPDSKIFVTANNSMYSIEQAGNEIKRLEQSIIQRRATINSLVVQEAKTAKEHKKIKTKYEALNAQLSNETFELCKSFLRTDVEGKLDNYAYRLLKQMTEAYIEGIHLLIQRKEEDYDDNSC